jgi:hypothetical protein
MRTIPYSFLTMLLIILSGCGKLDLEAQVLRYDFQDSQVFLFQPGNCGADLPTKVYDSNCNLICTLGGIEGNSICNAENFEENATNKVQVWKNE